MPTPPIFGPLVGALFMGASVWCAAGQVTVAAADAASVRLVAPASFWWFVLPALAALGVPASRPRPLWTAPALLSTMPWWPVVLPAACLIWTGPLAWFPIGVSVVLALASRRRDGAATGAPVGGVSSGATTAALAGVCTLACGAAVAVAVDERAPGGDEPHYLVITQSLLDDGDLRIENNHRAGDYTEYYAGTLAPDFIQRGANGEIYSIHAPGVSVLVAPAFALAGYRGAQATILMLSAVTGAFVWLIGWHATGSRAAAWFAWASVALSTTFLIQAGLVFPDGPAAVIVAASMWLLVRGVRTPAALTPAALATAGALLAILPWLHTRFAVLSLAFGLVFAWRISAMPGARVRRLLTFAAAPAGAAAAWFAFFWIVYGEPNPAAPYGADSGARLAYVPGGLVALLFDQQFGLLAYSPVLACAAAGLVSTRGRACRTLAWASMAVAFAYAAAVATYWMWWAGVPATPARFLTAVVPIAALPLAEAWAVASPGGRRVLGLLLAASLAITAVTTGVEEGSLAWNARNAEALWLEWLGPLANLPRAWPSFFWKLSPDDLSTEWPFVWHVVLFVGTLAAGCLLAVALGRRAPADGSRTGVILAWSLPLALMAASTVGWRLNGVNGLDPARSQLALAARVGQGHPIWKISPWAVGRAPQAPQILRVRPEEPGRTDTTPPLAAFDGVPAGRYELRVGPGRQAARLAVSLGRSARPLATGILDDRTEARLSVRLPAGARTITATLDPPDGREGRSVELAILESGRPTPQLAQSNARYGTIDVFFLDEAVYAEASGFWVRGGATAEWVVTTVDEGWSMLVQNGGAPNDVVVTLDGRTQALELGPSESGSLPLPPSAAQALHVRVESPAGFRPSEAGASDDRRFLGVWVQFVR